MTASRLRSIATRFLASRQALVHAVTTALLVLRCAPHVLGGRLDSDQAVIGLIGMNLSQGNGATVYTYGQSYLFALESWLAAPLFFAFGPSVTALKLPLFVMLVVTAIVLGRAALEEGLSRGETLLALSPLIVMTPWISMAMVAAHGGNPEPILAVALCWLLRRRPVPLGLVAGTLYMVRPFVAYPLLALVLMDVAFRRKERLPRHWLICAAGFLLVTRTLKFLAPYGTDYGGVDAPRLEFSAHGWFGTLISTLKLQVSGACGIYPGPVGYEPLSHRATALDWLAPCAFAATALVIVRIVWRLVEEWRNPWERYAFGFYLTLVGLFAWAPMVFFGMAKDIYATRYCLLVVFAPVGLLVLFYQLERSAWSRRLTTAFLVIKAALHIAVMVGIGWVYAFQSPYDPHRVLADHLVEHHVTSGIAPFWVAYNVSFITAKKVQLTDPYRHIFSESQRMFEQDLPGSVIILEEPCEGGTKVADWYVCPRHPAPP